MDIVIVMPSVGNGGAERVGVTLAGYLSAKGHRVSIVYFKGEVSYQVKGTVELYRLNYRKIPLLGHIFRAKDFISYCESRGTGLVIALHHGYDFTYLNHRRGKSRLILSERNDPALKYRGDWKNRIQMKWYYRDADRVVFQTERQMRYFPEQIQAKGRVIPNPVKGEFPEPFCGERRKIVVNFCRLVPFKNLKLLIDAFCTVSRQFPEYELRIYGEGPQREELEAYIEEKGLKGKAGILPFSKDIHREVRDMALFVSSSDREGISNSMMEALALGLPCICTDCPCGGAADVIDPGVNGLLVPVGDQQALERAMVEVLSDQTLSKTLSEHAIKVRRDYSADVVGGCWEALIRELGSTDGGDL